MILNSLVLLVVASLTQSNSPTISPEMSQGFAKCVVQRAYPTSKKLVLAKDGDAAKAALRTLPLRDCYPKQLGSSAINFSSLYLAALISQSLVERDRPSILPTSKASRSITNRSAHVLDGMGSVTERDRSALTLVSIAECAVRNDSEGATAFVFAGSDRQATAVQSPFTSSLRKCAGGILGDKPLIEPLRPYIAYVFYHLAMGSDIREGGEN